MSSHSKSVKKVSFFNWFITLIVSAIPGVNLLFFIGTTMFARNPSKRSYAVAALVLTLIILIALCVGIIFFGDEIVRWAEKVLQEAETATPVIE
ncbi:MAG: hypothetical protein IJC48_02255 [Clostridia bacterium]|nr:hypothetical protein [Clostridia bacterium]